MKSKTPGHYERYKISSWVRAHRAFLLFLGIKTNQKQVQKIPIPISAISFGKSEIQHETQKMLIF
jgi:hypothetical protein